MCRRRRVKNGDEMRGEGKDVKYQQGCQEGEDLGEGIVAT